jgi:hypothetical protein
MQKSTFYTRLLYMSLLESKIKALINARKIPEDGYYNISGFRSQKGKKITLKNRFGVSTGKVTEFNGNYFVLKATTGTAVVHAMLNEKARTKYKVSTSSEVKDAEAFNEYKVIVAKVIKATRKGDNYYKRTEGFYLRNKNGKTVSIKKMKSAQKALTKAAKPTMDALLEMGALAGREAQLDPALLKAYEVYKRDISRMFTWIAWTSYWVPSREAPLTALASPKKGPKTPPLNGLLRFAQNLDYGNQYAKEAQR